MPRDGIFEAFSRAWRNKEHKINDELAHGLDAALAGDAAAILDYGILASALGHDPAQAVAFQLAGLRLKYSDHVDKAKLEQQVELLRLSTSTYDMEKAVERAVQLLSDENCCYQFK